MKKFITIVVVTAAVALVSCEKKTDYKEMGQDYANRLEALCQKNDTTGVIAMDDSIRAKFDEIIAQGDSANLAAFREGLGKDFRDKTAPFVVVTKMRNGTSKQEAVQKVIDDVLNSRGGDASTVAATIKAALKEERKNKEDSIASSKNR